MPMINDTTVVEDLKYLYKYYNTNRVHPNMHPYKWPNRIIVEEQTEVLFL